MKLPDHLVKAFEQRESREHNQETFTLRMPLRGGWVFHVCIHDTGDHPNQNRCFRSKTHFVSKRHSTVLILIADQCTLLFAASKLLILIEGSIPVKYHRLYKAYPQFYRCAIRGGRQFRFYSGDLSRVLQP